MDNPTLEDAPKDPRAYQAFRQGYTEQDFEGKISIKIVKTIATTIIIYFSKEVSRLDT